MSGSEEVSDSRGAGDSHSEVSDLSILSMIKFEHIVMVDKSKKFQYF